MPEHLTLLLVPFLACVAMTAILGYLGLHVLRREIVFVDIAMAQVVAVGAIVASLLLDVDDESPLASVGALILAFLAAAFYAVTRRKILAISAEAVIGVSYAVAAAGALFLLGVAPGGHVHAQHMLAGSILWATWPELGISCAAFLVVGICFYLLHNPFEKISGDYQGAVGEGMKIVGWDFLFYALIGTVITFAVRIGGVVLVFCLLIIPATISVMLVRSVRGRLLIAWTAGVAGSFLGLLFADRLDFSVGPAVALILGVGLAVVGTWKRLHAAAAAGVTGVVLVAYILLLMFAPQSGAGGTVVESRRVGKMSSPPEAAAAAAAATAPDAQSVCQEVLQALEAGFAAGIPEALDFLSQDPPLFFRQMVVDRLDQGLPEPVGFDTSLPYGDPVNQKAAASLRDSWRRP